MSIRLVADLVDEVLFLIDREYRIVDGFHVVGPTEFRTDTDPAFYTYRSHLLAPGQCALCGNDTGVLPQACVSRQGYHAFVGVATVPREHRAEMWNVDVVRLETEGGVFYVDRENLFPISEIVEGWQV